MGVLEHINILGDALNLKVVTLHLVVQLQEVKGVPAGAPCLQVCEKVFWADLVVNSVGVSKLLDPCVRDDGEHELCRLPLRGFEGGAVCAPCLVSCFLPRTDNGLSVVVYIEIVGPDPLGSGERLAAAGDVGDIRPNEANEVVLSTSSNAPK